LRRDEQLPIGHDFGREVTHPLSLADEFLAASEAALAVGTRDGVDPLDRRIAELDRQIEKRDQVIGELTIALRVLS
jgi:hypothetical protein